MKSPVCGPLKTSSRAQRLASWSRVTVLTSTLLSKAFSCAYRMKSSTGDRPPDHLRCTDQLERDVVGESDSEIAAGCERFDVVVHRGSNGGESDGHSSVS